MTVVPNFCLTLWNLEPSNNIDVQPNCKNFEYFGIHDTEMWLRPSISIISDFVGKVATSVP